MRKAKPLPSEFIVDAFFAMRKAEAAARRKQEKAEAASWAADDWRFEKGEWLNLEKPKKEKAKRKPYGSRHAKMAKDVNAMRKQLGRKPWTSSGISFGMLCG